MTEVFLIPLFPHYAMSSYESAVVRVQEVAAKLAPQMKITVQPPFFDSPDYIAALVASAADFLKKDYDHLLFSFHGIPERHLKKSDPTGVIVWPRRIAARRPARRTRRVIARNVSRRRRCLSRKPEFRRENFPCHFNRGSAKTRG